MYEGAVLYIGDPKGDPHLENCPTRDPSHRTGVGFTDQGSGFRVPGFLKRDLWDL